MKAKSEKGQSNHFHASESTVAKLVTQYSISEKTVERAGFVSPMQSAYLPPMLAIGTYTGRQGYGTAQSHRCIARRWRESFHYRQGREKRAIVHHHE